MPPREGHVFKTKARAPTLVLLETVDDPDADTTCLREEDSESDDDKPSRRMTPAQNHPVRLPVSFVFPSSPSPSRYATSRHRRAGVRQRAAQQAGRGALYEEEPPTDDDHSTTFRRSSWGGQRRDAADSIPIARADGRPIETGHVRALDRRVFLRRRRRRDGRRKAGGAVATSRRNTSSTGLDTLAEADTPLDGEEPTPVPKISPRRVDTPEIGQPDLRRRWTSRRRRPWPRAIRRDGMSSGRYGGSKH